MPPSHRAGRVTGRRPHRATRHERRQHDHRRDHGGRREQSPPDLLGAGRHDEPRGDHRRQGDRPQHGDHARPFEQPVPAMGCGDHGSNDQTDEHLAGPRVGAVVDAIDAETEHERQGEGDDGADRGNGAEHSSRVPRPLGHDRRDDADDQVELLLDRQAPEVQHRRRSVEQVSVRGAVDEEVPVGHLQPRRDDVGPGRARQRRRRDPDHGDRGEHRPRSRVQAPGPASEETAQRDASRPLALVQQHRPDDHARQREEQGDAEVAARQPADVGVEEDDGSDGEAAEPIEPGLLADALAGRHLGERSRIRPVHTATMPRRAGHRPRRRHIWAGFVSGRDPSRIPRQIPPRSRCQWGRMSISRSHSSSETRRPLAAMTMLGTRPSRKAMAWVARPTAQRKRALDLPPLEAVVVEGATGRLVAGDVRRPIGEPADLGGLVAEAPHAQRRPRQILHRVARRQRALPVEHGPQAVLADDEVAVAHVGVDDRPAHRRRRRSAAASQRSPSSSTGRRWGSSSTARTHRLQRRTGGLGGGDLERAQRHVHGVGIDGVEAGEGLAELGGDELTDAVLGDEAQHAAGHGLAGHELRDHERPADQLAVRRGRGGRAGRRRRPSRPGRGRRPRRRWG